MAIREVYNLNSKNINTMTAPQIVDHAAVLGEALLKDSSDLMQHSLQTMINTLRYANSGAGASAERCMPCTGGFMHRNAYRGRDPDMRANAIGVAVSKI